VTCNNFSMLLIVAGVGVTIIEPSRISMILSGTIEFLFVFHNSLSDVFLVFFFLLQRNKVVLLPHEVNVKKRTI
jgi:hypothetical protein